MRDNPLVTILLVIIALAAADLFLNDGRALATLTNNENAPGSAVMQQQPEVEVWTIYGDEVMEMTATPGSPGGVTFTVLDDGSEPVIRDLVATAVPLPTYTPYPTYTPVKLINDYGLPPMGPYTLQQVETCTAIIFNGQIDMLPSPQRELCEMYTGD